MAATIESTTIDRSVSPAPSLWRRGLKAGAAAAVATTAVAAVAHALGVSFETAPGDAIPLAGFAQLTLVFTLVGILIARSIGRRAAEPRATWTKTALTLTALSFVPDLTLGFDAVSALTLMCTHTVAAAIVVPTIARRLPEYNVR